MLQPSCVSQLPVDRKLPNGSSQLSLNAPLLQTHAELRWQFYPFNALLRVGKGTRVVQQSWRHFLIYQCRVFNSALKTQRYCYYKYEFFSFSSAKYARVPLHSCAFDDPSFNCYLGKNNFIMEQNVTLFLKHYGQPMNSALIKKKYVVLLCK